MISAEDTWLVLLAAGRSIRFGAADKLVQDVAGRPLALHAVAAMKPVPFAGRIAVTSGTALDLAASGYDVIANRQPEAGLSRSVALGVARARERGAKAVLVALADMPLVTGALVRRLLVAGDGDDAVVASSDGERPTPPALFGHGRFDALLRLDGDAGARDLIRSGRRVLAAPDELVDVDTPDDLARLCHSWRSASIGLSEAARRAGK